MNLVDSKMRDLFTMATSIAKADQLITECLTNEIFDSLSKHDSYFRVKESVYHELDPENYRISKKDMAAIEDKLDDVRLKLSFIQDRLSEASSHLELEEKDDLVR